MPQIGNPGSTPPYLDSGIQYPVFREQPGLFQNSDDGDLPADPAFSTDPSFINDLRQAIEEASRGRMRFVTCRCVASKGPCGHFHTRGERSSRSASPSECIYFDDKRLCCECFGTAQTSRYDENSGRHTPHESSCGSTRTSSHSRQTKHLTKFLSYTPNFNHFVQDVENADLDKLADIPPLDKAEYNADPESYVYRLTSIRNSEFQSILDDQGHWLDYSPSPE